MLLTVGSQKVNSLDSSGLIEADVAKSTLNDVSRDVQVSGWHFNSRFDMRMLPDTNGYIYIPKNCLSIQVRSPGHPAYVTQQGNRLYNNRDNTFVFGRPVFVDMVLFLKFDDLIPAAQRYIMARASRRFQERVMGSQITEEFARAEEFDARAELQAADARNAGYNILYDNQPTRYTVFRDRID